MKQHDDATRVRHMVDAAQRARTIADERKGQDLNPDDVEALALVRLLEIMGEAARNVSDEVRTKYPQVPRRQIIGTRNRVIHAYFNVDMDIVWHIVDSELPSILEQLHMIRAQEGWERT